MVSMARLASRASLVSLFSLFSLAPSLVLGFRASGFASSKLEHCGEEPGGTVAFGTDGFVNRRVVLGA